MYSKSGGILVNQFSEKKQKRKLIFLALVALYGVKLEDLSRRFIIRVIKEIREIKKRSNEEQKRNSSRTFSTIKVEDFKEKRDSQVPDILKESRPTLKYCEMISL